MAPQQEKQTVVGVFRDYNTAREAARELTNIGVPESSVDIHSDQTTGSAGYGNSKETDYRKSSSGDTGITGWFHRTFGDSETDDSSEYSEAAQTGRALLSVTVPANQVDSVVNILNRHGAVDNESDRDVKRSGREVAGSDRQTASIPVVEEELTVGKRAVQRGGVRVYSRIVEQPVSEQINLREEHVRVERRPVDRALTTEEAGRLRDQTIELTETSEEAVVGKRARVREEILLDKETTERTETVNDTVRRTEVKVENIDDERNRPTPATTRKP